MDTPILSSKDGIMMVNLYSSIGPLDGTAPAQVCFDQHLPITGEKLLAIACEKIGFKGTAAKLTRSTEKPNLHETHVKGFYEFNKERYGGTTIRLFLKACPPPRKNPQGRKTTKKRNKDANASKIPEHVNPPSYNPSKKLAKMVNVIADADEALEDEY